MIDERTNLVAPCGIDCGICELYICRGNTELYEHLVKSGIPESKLPCNGCRAVDGHCPVNEGICKTFTCVALKDVDYCFECFDFPCSKLNPSADRASVLPHNLKVFNLCTIQRTGVLEFIEHSAQIRKKYYREKMEIGNGPSLEQGN